MVFPLFFLGFFVRSFSSLFFALIRILDSLLSLRAFPSHSFSSDQFCVIHYLFKKEKEMGCAGGKLTDSEKEQQKLSRDIDKWLRDDGKEMLEEIKILLLGPGESGKSTIFKQCKIIQEGGGFDDTELKAFAEIVAQNAVSQMQVLLTYAQKLGFSLGPGQETEAKMVNDATNTPVVPPALATAIKNLWASEPIQS